MAVSEMLVIINNTAITEVNFVKKLPALLEDIKESLPDPIPKAPPSDFCIKTEPISKMANIICIVKIIFSTAINYNSF